MSQTYYSNFQVPNNRKYDHELGSSKELWETEICSTCEITYSTLTDYIFLRHCNNQFKKNRKSEKDYKTGAGEKVKQKGCVWGGGGGYHNCQLYILNSYILNLKVLLLSCQHLYDYNPKTVYV